MEKNPKKKAGKNKSERMKYLTIIIIAIIAFSCHRADQSQPSNQPISLPVMTLREDSVTLYSEFPARIEGKVNIDVRSQVDGYIQKIYVEEGAYVKAGQPLFKIDDRSSIEQVNTARANLNAALAAQKNAQLEVEKYMLLSQNRVTSDFQLKTARAQYETALANVAQQKAILETAKINLGYTRIKAPVNGFIGRIPKRIGNLVSVSNAQALTTLSDISEVYVYFSMTEQEFLLFNARYKGNNLTQKIAKIAQVSLKLADNSIYPYRGKIQVVNGEFDQGTGSVSVRAVFKNPTYLLRTGNTGRVILPYVEQKALKIPVLATLDVQDKIFVMRLNKANKAERVAITISGKQGDYYIVKSGLHTGDRIVTQELGTIQEGTTIQPK